MWVPLLPTLTAAHSVTMIDAIGEPGKSIATKPITNVTQKVEWLDETLRAVDIERSAIVAASHGTLIATHYTMAFPDRVDRLALVCPVGIVSTVRLRKLLRALTTGGVRPTERRIQSLLDTTVMPTNRGLLRQEPWRPIMQQFITGTIGSSLPAAIYRSAAICNGSHRPKFQFWRSSAGMNRPTADRRWPPASDNNCPGLASNSSTMPTIASLSTNLTSWKSCSLTS